MIIRGDLTGIFLDASDFLLYLCRFATFLGIGKMQKLCHVSTEAELDVSELKSELLMCFIFIFYTHLKDSLQIPFETTHKDSQ